ncbi:hypothetical protein BDAP_002851 [Binucleata daphniae]
MKLKVFLFIYFCILFIGSTFTCFTKKKPEADIAKIIPARWKDLTYINQMARIGTCLKELPTQKYNKKEEMHKYWMEQANDKITKKMTHENKLKFIEGKFMDCLVEVAEHEVHKILCHDYIKNIGIFDAIELYNELDFAECLINKNVMFSCEIEFNIPAIDFGDIRFDLDDIENYIE